MAERRDRRITQTDDSGEPVSARGRRLAERRPGAFMILVVELA
jgi:hypothetical protein